MAAKNALASHLALHWEYIKVALKTAMEYRVNFLIQTSAMFVNDLVWIFFWTIFFLKFGSVAGWQIGDVLMLYAITTMTVGLSGIFFGNWRYLTRLIVQGRLDYFLTLPKNTLYHMLSSRMGWTEIGDLTFGVLLAVLFIPAAKWPLFLLLTGMAIIIFVSFCVIVGSIAFFTQSSESISDHIIFTVITFATYPMSIFQGVARVLILTVVPAGFVAGVPVMLVRSFSWEWFLLMAGFTVLIAALAATAFYAGLRRYESGNLIYVRD